MSMNEEKFKDQLSKIARWFIPIVNDYSQVKKPAVNANPEAINTTLGPIIEELTIPPTPCDWCGKIVNQSVNYQRVLPKVNELPKTKSVWVSHCKTCGLYKNPVTEELQKNFPNEVTSNRKWSEKRRATYNRIKR